MVSGRPIVETYSAAESSREPIDGYGPSLMFALSSFLFLGNMVLIVRLKFLPERRLDWFSCKPYYLIVAYLLMQMAQSLVLAQIQMRSLSTEETPFQVWQAQHWARIFLSWGTIGSQVLFLLFVGWQNFEWFVMLSFIHFQNRLSIEEFEIKQGRHQEYERKIKRIFFAFWSLFAVIFLGLFIAQESYNLNTTKSYEQTHNVQDILYLTYCLLYLWVLALLNMLGIFVFSSLTWKLLTTRNDAYWRHVYRHYGQAIGLFSSTVVFMFVAWENTLEFLCFLVDPLDNILYSSEDICHKIDTYALNHQWNFRFYFIQFLVGLIPIGGFLISKRPHDCFECLNKFPGQDFSSFQIKIPRKTSPRRFYNRTSKITFDMDFQYNQPKELLVVDDQSILNDSGDYRNYNEVREMTHSELWVSQMAGTILSREDSMYSERSPRFT